MEVDWGEGGMEAVGMVEADLRKRIKRGGRSRTLYVSVQALWSQRGWSCNTREIEYLKQRLHYTVVTCCHTDVRTCQISKDPM